ncbi:MAG: cytochrome P450 [Actinobacteria bacterium]|nr:cytochrome P450 [Actinomycetota bacterium]
MTSVYGPVADWQSDFDHADPEYNRNIHAIWEDLKAAGCPIARTERYGGAWLPLTHEMVHEIAYDTDHFTSRTVVVGQIKPHEVDHLPEFASPPAPIGGAPPITSDPPFHQHARRLLLPAFAPKKIDPLRPEIERMCNELIDKMGDKDAVDAAVEYSQHIPVMIIAHMLGLPLEDADRFRSWVHLVLESVNAPREEREGRFHEFNEYLETHIRDHIENPREDLINDLLNAELMGTKLTSEMVGGMVTLILIAGIDTTWSGIGNSIWHLATNAVDRRRLAANPDMIPVAVEEFLRAYAPVTMARLVTEDHEFHGVQMKQHDWVLLPFPAANRDPEQFENPTEVVIDREVNRHSAFGLGIHRCIGSNLARLEMNVAVKVFLERFPDFELVTDEETVWSTGQVRGPRRLPVRVLSRR